MSLAETAAESDWQMNEADKVEFTERVLLDDEEIVTAFRIDEHHSDPRSIVFTSKRLVLESEGSEPIGFFGEHTQRKRLLSIPYGSISMHAVVLDTTRGPEGMRGVLRLWVRGYYNDDGPTGSSAKRWVGIAGDDKLDLHMLSRILSAQMEM